MSDIRIAAKAKYKTHCGKPVYRVSYALHECKLTEKYPECPSRNNGVCLAHDGCVMRRREEAKDINLTVLKANRNLWVRDLSGIFQLNGKKLTDSKARHIINRAIESGYTMLSEIPDSEAEQWLKEKK